MRVLVTGATGFLGKALCVRLQKNGFRVTALGRNFKKSPELSPDLFSLIQSDLADRDAILKACQHQDFVFHCGALSSPFGKYADFFSANVTGTQNVIAGCFQHSVKRLIYISTPSLYFDFHSRRNISESDPLPKKFANHYAHTKWLAEKEIDKAHEKGLEVITFRPRAIFGPGDNAILPRLLKAHAKMPLPLFRHGETLIDLTYIDNLLDVLCGSMNTPHGALGKKFNISNGQSIRVIDLYERLFKKLNIPLKTRDLSFPFAYSLAFLMEYFYRVFKPSDEPPFTRYTLGLLAFDQTLDISAAKNLLHYQPKISMEEGLDRFVNSNRKQI